MKKTSFSSSSAYKMISEVFSLMSRGQPAIQLIVAAG